MNTKGNINMIRLLVAASLVSLSQGTPLRLQEEESGAGTCGYDSCTVPKPGMLNVHLVPHTHDDVGWLKTLDQYYFGSKTYIQNAGVQYILDSVVNELLHDPKKKFIYVETAFFWKWWKEQEDHMKHRVKQLVKNGQLEFIGGAWSMNDEATTHYQSTIDQFTWGLRKLNDTFGVCGQPKIGWQIDPFGHSKEMASMMAQFGFDGLFFGRLDYQDKRKRMETTTMEMIWQGSSSLGSSANLFTGVLFNGYSPPNKFCFDILCEQEDPFVDDPHSPEYNADEYVNYFISYAKNQSQSYKTNNIIMTFGMDFRFQFAHKNFKNMDKLIRRQRRSHDWCLVQSLFCASWLLFRHSLQRRSHNNRQKISRLQSGLKRSKSDVFTGALFNLYMAPTGFCFDIMCGDEPIIEDKNSPDYNAFRKATKFLEAINWQAVYYRSENIMITMGGDFNYLDAHYYFKNLDKLIRHVNDQQKTGSKVNVFYSTPSCYLKSLNDANMTWPTKEDDFFPYASDPHAYWTGYFTSRPTLKYFERLGNKLLQTCKQVSSLASLGPEDNPDIDALREAMGVMQHHDAITGTEKQHVAFDYARILHSAIDKCQTVMTVGLNKLMAKPGPTLPKLPFETCLLSNISECSVSATSKSFLVTVYNPLSRPVNYFVRLPVTDSSYSVKYKQRNINTQIIPIPKSLHDIPGRSARSELELIFKAEAVPPLGYRTYLVKKQDKAETMSEQVEFEDEEEVAVGDDSSFLTLNTTTGLLTGVSFEGRKVPLSQTLQYYIGSAGTNSKFSDRASGAYIFRPNGNSSFLIAANASTVVYKGPLVTEIHQFFSSWASQVTRKYSGENTVEVEWMVGPIPVDDMQGKEIVALYTTNINNKGLFSTDSNGRQTLVRKRNFRPTWNVEIAEPVAGNYYPITTDISINDGELELTVLVDRAQGGSSIRDGEIELMLHRRLLYDDGFGVAESLNEMAYGSGLIARGQHWIILGNVSNPTWPKQKRLLQQEKVLSPHILVSDVESINYEDLEKYNLEFSGLKNALPPTVNILTLEPWKGKSYLLRLEHILDKTETSEVVTVDLSNLFSAFEIISIRETSLAADRWLSDVNRLKWKKETNEVLEEEDRNDSAETSFPKITLKPKEIRTFVCEIKPKSFI